MEMDLYQVRKTVMMDQIIYKVATLGVKLELSLDGNVLGIILQYFPSVLNFVEMD